VSLNNTNGTSYFFAYNPTPTAAETIGYYSGPNQTGTKISNIVDNTDGTSLAYAYNPTATAILTAQQWSGTNPANGAPAGNLVSDVVDNTDGTCLVYAYNPTSTVVQTAQQWSMTNPANGAPAGTEISNVVNNTDGTTLLYSYNPTSTVTLTVADYSATNPANGAPAGNELSDVVDNTDGTSILYAYMPTSTVSLTATYYSATAAGSGAPTGSITSETFDYNNGESAIATYNANGVAMTIDYSGPNGTGSVISSIGGSILASAMGTATAIASQADASDTATIAIAGSGELIDPGTGNRTIQFVAGATDDTLVLHSGGTDQILGFDPSAGDALDLSSLLGEAGINIGDISRLANYVTVANANGAAAILFDPTGQGGGSQVALLENDAGLVAGLQTLKGFVV
jgi:hypothetical protein